MRKCLWTALSVLLVGLVAVPSSDAAFIPRLGLSVGANFQSMNDIEESSVSETFGTQTGYNAGLFVEMGFGSWAVRPGVEYLNAGPLFDGASFATSDFDLSYVVVPVDLKMSLPTGPVSPYAFTGPEFRVLASAGDAPSDLEEGLKDFGVNWSFGMGIAMGAPGPGLKFAPEVRYSRDLSGVTNEEFEFDGTTITTESTQKAHSFRAALKVLF